MERLETLPPKLREAVERFVDEAREALGENLRSVILYGSAARGEFSLGRSDVNLLVLLGDAGPEALSRIAPVVRRAMERGLWPVVLSWDELMRSSDVFPIEHLDLKQARQVLYGADPAEEVEVKDEDLRRQLEFEARAKLIRLRQAYMRDFDRPRALLDLAARSFPSFVVLFKTALKLVGREVPSSRAEVISAVSEALSLDREGLTWALKAHSGEAKKAEAKEWFPRYLKAVEQFVRFLDQWRAGKAGAIE